jgi:hypothetical protein
MTAPLTVSTTELGHASGGAGGWWGELSHEATPELRWPASVDVYDRMRKQDAQVASVLRAVTLPVRRTPWWIDPNGARDEVVQLVAEDLGLPVLGQEGRAPLRTAGRFSWGEHLQLSLLDLVFGHMFFEQVYALDERGRARLRKLAPRLPRTISKVNVADDGGLVSIEQHTPSLTVGGAMRARPGDPIVIPVARLVAYVNDREGGGWLGSSLLRPAYKHWMIKDRLLRVQAQTIERNGMGVPVYEAGPKETELTRGEALARSFRSGDSAGAAIPNAAKLRLAGVEGSLPDSNPAIRYHDEQIARTVLAHALNLGQQTGSWALGTTFMDFFTLSLQTVAETRRDVVNQHVVEDLVDINFGPTEPAPRVGFEEIGSRQQVTAQAIKLLIDAGALSGDPGLERHLRQQLRLPALDEDGPAPEPADGSS